MKGRFFALILVFLLALTSLALLLEYADRHDSVTLAELTGHEQGGGAAQIFRAPARAVFEEPTGLADMRVELFFYGVLGICGLLLALRALISALNILREERAPKIAPRRRDDSPQTVVLWPRRALEEEAWRKIVGGAAETGAGAASSKYFPARWLPHRYGLTRRLALSFVGVVAAFGLVTIFLVQFTLTASLRRHAIARARVIAVNVSDNAAGYLAKKNPAALRELLRKHANRPEVAYFAVQNRAGEIFAHSLAVLPEEIHGEPALSASRGEGLRSFPLGEGMVDELTVPVMDGQVGVVRLGLWREEIGAEIGRSVRPLMKYLLLAVGAGVLAALYLAWRINRPILRLVRAAQRISSGDLDAPSLGTEDRSEFGELSRALERMRSSIKAALLRLSDQG